MTWQPEIDDIHRRRALVDACGGAEAVAKHHPAGKRADYDADGKLKPFAALSMFLCGMMVLSIGFC